MNNDFPEAGDMSTSDGLGTERAAVEADLRVRDSEQVPISQMIAEREGRNGTEPRDLKWCLQRIGYLESQIAEREGATPRKLDPDEILRLIANEFPEIGEWDAIGITETIAGYLDAHGITRPLGNCPECDSEDLTRRQGRAFHCHACGFTGGFDI